MGQGSKYCEALPSPMAGVLLLPVRRRDGSVKACIWIDEADYEWAKHHKWGIRKGDYAYRHQSHRTEGTGTVTMHREMLGLEPGDSRQGEHKNRNRLDNRRCNLRIVGDQAENLQNVPARGGRSKYRGVDLYLPTGRWRARVQIRGRQHNLGYFADEEEAAAAAAAYRAEHMPYATE